MVNNHWLAVSNMNFIFHFIYGIILPIDWYFSRWLKPPTSISIVTGYLRDIVHDILVMYLRDMLVIS